MLVPKGQKGLNGFTFGSVTGRFPSNSAASTTMKGLTSVTAAEYRASDSESLARKHTDGPGGVGDREDACHCLPSPV